MFAALGGPKPGSAAEPPITALAFAPDGRSVLAGSQAGLEVRAWPSLKKQRALATKLVHIHDLAFAPDGTILAAAGGSPSESGAVELFHWPGGELIRRDDIHDDLVYAISWRRDSKAIATASLDRTVQIQSYETGASLRILRGHSRGVLAVAYLPNGRTLVSAGIDQSLRVWDTQTGRVLHRLENHTGAVLSLALRPGQPEGSEPVVASIGADRTVRFWQPARGRMVRLARLPSQPQALAWARKGNAVAVACTDGHVRVIDPGTAALEADLPALKGRAFSLAATGDGVSFLVGGQGGQLRRVIDPRSQSSDQKHAARFEPLPARAVHRRRQTVGVPGATG